MNIFGINPSINIIGRTNKKSSGVNLNYSIKDTVSFSGSVSTKKKIEEFKKLNKSDYANQDISDVIKILEYFGYKEVKKSSQITYTGPYGQKVLLKNEKQVQAKILRDIIRGLNQADELGGELIVIDRLMSEEEKAKWKKTIAETKPLDGYVNQYALDIQEEPVTTVEIVEPLKDNDKKINGQKTIISHVLSSFARSQDDLNGLIKRLDSLKAEAKTSKVVIPDEDIKDIENKIKEKEEEFQTKTEVLNKFKEKLSFEVLSEEEVEKLNEYEKDGINLDEVTIAIENIEGEFLNSLLYKDKIIERISEQQNSILDGLSIFLEQYEEIQAVIDEVNYMQVFDKDLKHIKPLVAEIESKINDIKSKIEDIEKINLQNASTEELQIISNRLRKLNSTFMPMISVKFEEVNNILDTNIRPCLESYDEIKEKRKQTAWGRFERPTTDNSNDVQIAEEKVDAPIEVEDTSVVDDTPVIKDPNVSPIEETTVLETDAKEVINLDIIKSNLADKISIVPLAGVKTAMTELLDSKLTDEMISNLSKDSDSIKNFITNFLMELTQSNEYVKINNALRFSLIDAVYNASSDKNGEIYNLTPDETKLLFEKIQNGEKNISIETEKSQINITLEKAVNLDEINETFLGYKQSCENLDVKTADKIVAELTKYIPGFPEKDKDLLYVLLGTEGQYITLLTKEDINNNLKNILLSTVWKKFDGIRGTNYTEQVIKNHNAEQVKVTEEEKHARKLDNIKKQNWTIV